MDLGWDTPEPRPGPVVALLLLLHRRPEAVRAIVWQEPGHKMPVYAPALETVGWPPAGPKGEYPVVREKRVLLGIIPGLWTDLGSHVPGLGHSLSRLLLQPGLQLLDPAL